MWSRAAIAIVHGSRGIGAFVAAASALTLTACSGMGGLGAPSLTPSANSASTVPFLQLHNNPGASYCYLAAANNCSPSDATLEWNSQGPAVCLFLQSTGSFPRPIACGGATGSASISWIDSSTYHFFIASYRYDPAQGANAPIQLIQTLSLQGISGSFLRMENANGVVTPYCAVGTGGNCNPKDANLVWSNANGPVCLYLGSALVSCQGNAGSISLPGVAKNSYAYSIASVTYNSVNDTYTPISTLATLMVQGVSGLPASAQTVIDAASPAFGTCDWQGSSLSDVNSPAQPCLQNAINAAGAAAVASNGSASVLVPAGTFGMSLSLQLASNVSLVGAGPNSVLERTAGLNAATESAILASASGISHSSITNLTFDGGNYACPGGQAAISVGGSTGVVFTGFTLRNTPCVGMAFVWSNNSGLVGSHILNVGNRWKQTHSRTDRLQGVIFYGNDSSFAGSYANGGYGTFDSGNFAVDTSFEDIGLDALQITYNQGFNAQGNLFNLKDNEFNLISSPDFPAGIYGLFAYGATIQYNNIFGAQGNGIDAPGIGQTLIEDNTIAYSGGAGIGLFSAASTDSTTYPMNVTMNDNKLIDNVQWPSSSFCGGISVDGTASQGVVVSGNSFIDQQASPTQYVGVFAYKTVNLCKELNFAIPLTGIASSINVDATNIFSGNTYGNCNAIGIGPGC
jgi:hypothetical protein